MVVQGTTTQLMSLQSSKNGMYRLLSIQREASVCNLVVYPTSEGGQICLNLVECCEKFLWSCFTCLYHYVCMENIEEFFENCDIQRFI